MPGGQPSTIQPSAGPWLSPNVVTVNKVPKVLPDMGAAWAARRLVAPAFEQGVEARLPLARRQPLELVRGEHEHASPTASQLGPDERHIGKGGLERHLGVADLADQDTAGLQVCGSARKDSPHDVEAILAAEQAELGL